VIVGAFIPLASIPMTIVLLLAIFTVHLPNGFSSIKLQSVVAPELTSDSRDTRRTCCTLRAWPRWYWVGWDPSRLIGCDATAAIDFEFPATVWLPMHG